MRYQQTHEAQTNAFSLEVDKVHVTLDRLKRLRYERVIENNVYGSLSTQPERLAETLQRWLAHPENRVVEQLAMAPTSANEDALLTSIYGYTPGMPYTLDIDSIV